MMSILSNFPACYIMGKTQMSANVADLQHNISSYLHKLKKKVQHLFEGHGSHKYSKYRAKTQWQYRASSAQPYKGYRHNLTLCVYFNFKLSQIED